MNRPRSAAEIIMVLGLNGAAELVLLASTVLRETPIFWRNAGGYPIWLRQLVYFGHYPLLCLVMAGTAGGSLMALGYLARYRGSGAVLFMCSALQWLLLVTILAIMMWNNLDNLLHGRPLHYHQAI